MNNSNNKAIKQLLKINKTANATFTTDPLNSIVIIQFHENQKK